MPTKFSSISNDLAAAITAASRKICGDRPGFECFDELTHPKLRVALAELTPEILSVYDAVPRHEIKQFIRQNAWWK